MRDPMLLEEERKIPERSDWWAYPRSYERHRAAAYTRANHRRMQRDGRAPESDWWNRHATQAFALVGEVVEPIPPVPTWSRHLSA